MSIHNIYFYHPSSPILEEHTHIFLGSGDQPENIPVDENFFRGIRNQMICYNMQVQKSALKVLDRTYVYESEHLNKPNYTIINASRNLMILALLEYLVGSNKETLKNFAISSFPTFENVPESLNNPYHQALFGAQYLFFMSSILYDIGKELFFKRNQTHNVDEYLKHRYWEIIEIKTAHSSAARLFFSSITNNPATPTLYNSLQYFFTKKLTHPNENRNLTFTKQVPF